MVTKTPFVLSNLLKQRSSQIQTHKIVGEQTDKFITAGKNTHIIQLSLVKHYLIHKLKDLLNESQYYVDCRYLYKTMKTSNVLNGG